MSTSKLAGLLCVTLCIIFSKAAVSQTNSGAFTFNLSSSARTSAGVYQKDSTLVRTLWADKTYSAGTYTEYWDGKDDYGKLISSPDANYDIKILSNNVSYTWDGIIGNTSTVQTGSAVHKGYYTSMTGMAIAGATAYFCQGYSENYSSIAKFDLSDPQVRLDIFPGRTSTLNTDFVATDGNYVYWAGYNAYLTTNSFVHATKVSDDSQVSFGTNGTAYTITKLPNAKVYSSVIDKLIIGGSKPTGLAVQQSGNYLFVAHGFLNELHVLDKTSGALVQNLSYINPRFLSTDGNSLWMVTGKNIVSKYTVNNNGTLSASTLTLSGVTIPGAIQSNGNGTIAVIDSTNQVVRFFNTSTGTEGMQLGTNGGYSTNPTVTNTRFMFNDYRGNTFSFLAFAPNGSFWVGDPGNFRELHYNSSKAWIETIMSMGSPYSVCADPNNITRAFGNYLEFAIDYSKPLSGSTGWALVKNWGYASLLNNTPTITTTKLLNVTTLSNGRTYGYNYLAPAGLVELTSTGLRNTGVSLIGHTVSVSLSSINADGSLTNFAGSYGIGSTVTYSQSPLTGFDGSGNPIWSTTGTLLATTPTNTLKDPNNFPGNVSPVSYNFITASGKVIFYNPSKYYQGTTLWDGYHLGAIKKGQNTWLWKTQKVDDINYQGSFPEADYFEIGNSVNQYAGSNVNVVGNNIITGYHGEFWKNTQTNYYNHYWEDGLAIGQFGTDGFSSTGTAAAMKAGNALSPIVVKAANGDLYLYHGDESNHGGIHRWKISNLSSISEQYINIGFPSNYTRIGYGYLDLHSGLPYMSALPNSAGWVQAGTITSNTGLKKYTDDGSPDVYSVFSQTTGTASITRDLGNNNVSKSWKISGQLSFEGSDFVTGSHIISYVDVLDASGEIITRFNYIGNPNTKVITIYANNVIIANTTGLSGTLSKYQPFEVAIVNGQVSYTYANFSTAITSIFDATANWKQPKTLRQYFVTGGAPAYNKNIGFMDMKFYKDYSQAINIPPVANAGADQAITLPLNTVTLSGNGTDADGTIVSYSWTKISGPSSGVLSNANNFTTTLTSLNQGTYTFELKVTDNIGANGVDTVQIVVNAAANIPPVADAGADQAITLPSNSVTLTGTGTDTDGSIAQYLWTKISGPSSGSITNANNATTTVAALVQGTYNFELKVTDNSGATDLDTVQIVVNAALNIPPVADAGADQAITLPSNSVTLTGSGTDADGSITNYSWTKISGPSGGTIGNANNAATTVTSLVQGTYDFELKVTDNSGAIDLDTVQVIVNATANIPPVADAGKDQAVTLPSNSVVLTGAGTDADGSITNYSWTKISGPSSGTISNANNATTTVTGLVQGTYNFELKVTDNSGATGADTIQIIVNAAANIPPVADAGTDQAIMLPSNGVILNGAGTDTDGTITKYFWTKISGPSSGTVTNANNAATTVTGLVQGTYNFELKVTDNFGATGVDTMQVIVNAAANIPPVANAGADQAITLPSNSVTLTGTGTDADGSITNYSWTKISGPASGTITNANNATTIVTGLIQSTYNFELKVTDNSGATDVDTVQILVNPPANIPPVANAGMDQVITLPNNVVSLAGSGGDADGSIVAYAWRYVSGPSSYNIVNPSSPVTDISGLIGGTYSFELKVTDNSGAIARDTMQVTVNLVANIPPVVDAGTDQMLILPKNRAALNGTANDPDGTVAGYLWKEIAGPQSARIANANAANTVISNLTQGDYLFELSVTDDLGGVGKDTVQITVVASSLPLKLLSFTGKIQNNLINLFWETTNERNVLGFEIERMNGVTWNKVGFVPANNSGLISNQYAFTDSLPSIGSNYYRLKIIDVDGKFIYSDIISFEVNPRKNLIYQNFPNPFPSITTIKFDIAQKSSVKVIVYNSIGIQVAVLLNEIKQPGVYQIKWNASNVAQGNYFYKVILGETVVTNKMLKIY